MSDVRRDGEKPDVLQNATEYRDHLKAELAKVDDYLDSNGLRRQELFKRVLQSLVELSPRGSEERSLLESISNHIQAKGAVEDRQPKLFATEIIEHSEN